MSGLLHDGLSDLALDIATAGFGALWDGRAVRPEDLRPGHARRARRATAELVGRGRAEIDDHGRIVGVHGLTLRQTRHHFVHAGRSHQTWCAFDSIGIPAALAIDAEARTTCPSCDRALRVPIRGGHPEPSGIALWIPSGTVRHLMVDFCAAADLYCGRDHLEQRIDPARDPGEVLDLASAATLGRAAWADVAGRSLGLEHGPC
jgi:alkylmercury lyase